MNRHNFTPLTPLTFLERNGLYNPDGVAVEVGEEQVTYANLLKGCRKLATLLMTLGVEKGDSVGVLTLNALGSIQSHFAVPGVGAVIVCLNPWLKSGELSLQVAFCDVEVLLVTQDLYRKNLDLFTGDWRNKSVVILDGFDGMLADGMVDFTRVIDGLSSDMRLDIAIEDENDPIAINFTSGTTGAPKAVIYSHRAAYLHSLGQVNMLQLTESSVYFWSLPMFHVNGWGHIWAAVAAGTTQVVDEVVNLGAVELLACITRWRVSHLCGAPRLVRLLTELALAPKRLTGLTVMTGGAAPTPNLVAAMDLLGVNLIHQYGLNETLGPFVVCERRVAWNGLPQTIRVVKQLRQGVPALHAGCGLSVLDIAGNPVEWNGTSVGEVVMSGNTLALGYFKNTEATEKAFKGGWFYSGDVAVVHADGYLEIKDRIKDLIFVETDYGWENISSIEIENCISRIDGIKDVAVVGVVEEASDSSKVVAFIEVNENVVLTEDFLREHCREFLPEYKIPARFIHNNLPKTATGKVQKNQLVQLGHKIVQEVNLVF